MARSLLTVAAWSLVTAGGVLSVGAHTGWLNPAQPPDLGAFPDELGSLHTVVEHEVPSGVLGDLPPDGYTFRTVADEAGRRGELFVAYFERGRRWSGRPHDLAICYRTLGWEPLASRRIETPAGARIWMRDFARGEERIRVVHWLQRPGLLPGSESPAALLRRMTTPMRMRQDMASIYFQFPAGAAPPEQALAAAADAAIRALEDRWIAD